MPKTLDNVGALARTTFEDELAPMYHVRNMAGSTKDAVMATMKIPNQNFIIPSKYDIVERPDGSESLRAINRKILNENEETKDQISDVNEEIETTFNKVL